MSYVQIYDCSPSAYQLFIYLYLSRWNEIHIRCAVSLLVSRIKAGHFFGQPNVNRDQFSIVQVTSSKSASFAP